MLGLLILPMLLGLVLTMSDDDEEDVAVDAPQDDTDDDDANTFTEYEGDVITLRDTDTYYTGTFAGIELQGNDLNNTIEPFGGDDTVVARGGDDWVDGGQGDDVLYGNDGNDFVFGGTGDDRIFLGDGDDSSGNIINAEVDKTLGDDFVRGGTGNDEIRDSFGSNTLIGDQGNDILVAIDGHKFTAGIIDPSADFGSADTLNGGAGDDFLSGDDGDVFTGGAGADEFEVVTVTTRDQDAVQITDFDIDNDFLTFYSDDEGDFDEVTLEYDDDTGGVVATIADRQVAILQGLKAADIPNIQARLIRY